MKPAALTALLGLLAVPGAPAEAKPYTRNVAIVVYENAQPLDWTGPYEVYNDAASFGSANDQPAFNVYVVSKTKDPLNLQGLTVTPTYSIEDAPKPDIVVFPGGPSSKIYGDPEFFAWASKVSREAEIAQSVCTGAFVLAKAGLLDGLEVTTFHGSIDRLQKDFPAAQVKRGRRFVDNGKVVTTAGISAGIDGSLHVVARLLGRRVADEVATYMEYAWVPEASNAQTYAYLNPSTDARGRTEQAGQMELAEKRYGEAEATFRALLEQDPNSRSAWWSLGDALRAQKKHSEAGDAYLKSVKGEESRHGGHGSYLAATELAQAGRKEDAIASLEKALGAGFSRTQAATDPALAAIAQDPRVKQLVAAQ